MFVTIVSTSSMLLYLPYEMRIADFACCSVNPIAISTCEGSSLPDVQAELVDTNIPFESSKCISDSPVTPSKTMFIIPGKRLFSSPLIIFISARIHLSLLEQMQKVYLPLRSFQLRFNNCISCCNNSRNISFQRSPRSCPRQRSSEAMNYSACREYLFLWPHKIYGLRLYTAP